MAEQTPVYAIEATRAALDGSIQGDSYFNATMTNCGLSELPDGLILDLGAGPRGMFQYEAAIYSPDSKIISVGPIFAHEMPYTNRVIYLEGDPASDHLSPEELQIAREHTFIGAAALAQDLPFQDDSFDLVFSHASIPGHLPASRGENPNYHYERAIKEAVRVAQPDKKIVFAPMLWHEKQRALQALQSIGLGKEHFVVEEIPVADYSWDNEWHRITITKPR